MTIDACHVLTIPMFKFVGSLLNLAASTQRADIIKVRRIETNPCDRSSVSHKGAETKDDHPPKGSSS